MTRQLKKQVQNQSQSGRSMVEMLGVLAIIAILSIGGIVGYKLAMNYYQADQIANEINLMRNDLKVKYALGNEELLLGDPYDDTPENEDYSGHLSTQYDRYPVDYDCIIRGNKESKNELYNCREADAYYIAVGNISKGVCKPLTTLVAAMDGRLEMDINGLSYTGGDSCTSDEANEIYVEFDAEEVNGNYDSNRPEGWCAKDDDCEEPQVCDEKNNTCVECVKNADCDSNICRKDHTCGECASDSDCINIEKPKCNQNTNTCESCPAATPKWNGNACVECITSADCTNPDEPKCEESTHTCKPCPPKSVFYEGECVPYDCRSNEDCKDGEYCYLYEGCGCTADTEFENGNPKCNGGTCKNAQNEAHPYELSDGYTYYFGNDMDWFSAKRFCDALHAEMITLETLNCSNLNHCDHRTDRNKCKCTTQLVDDLYKAHLQGGKDISDYPPNMGTYFYWLNSDFNVCRSHSMGYGSHVVTNRRRDHDDNDGTSYDGALCRKKN